MASDQPPQVAVFKPLDLGKDALALLDEFVRQAGMGGSDSELRGHLAEALEGATALPQEVRHLAEASLRVLFDHALQGWGLEAQDDGVLMRPQEERDGSSGEEKDRIRRQELLKRDEQLALPATRRFVKELERRRIFGESFVSIFDLFRDGRELAEKLRDARKATGEERTASLEGVIDPYLVFVDDKALCPHTGLRLMDIWRYFRHTWANQYASVPGRTMMFIVRDRAAAMHPVIGIGALSSPIVQIQHRDSWIGWHPKVFLEELRSNPLGKIGGWLRRTVSGAIEELYTQDFLEAGPEGCGLSPASLRSPTLEVIETLREYAQAHRERHQQHPDQAEHKVNTGDVEGEWVRRSRTNLFTSKRALALAEYLEAQLVIEGFLSEKPTKAEVAALANDKVGSRVILRVVRKAKADRVGIAMADISVCGAVPPYGPILGGKLVTMLAASPSVVSAYKRRYQGAVSEIASAMAGSPIQRPSALVFLGTTSLYGRSSQYNRVRVPAELLGGEPGTAIRYHELGESESYGTSQYSAETVRAFDEVLTHSAQGKRVNYIFGEGTSPKLRKVREGLTLLGFPADLLRHHRRRVVYGIPLIANLKGYLLGMEAKPKYLFKVKGDEATTAVAEWWRERWLHKRIDSDKVLEAVEEHTLTFPIRHGARVVLPPEETCQLSLFEDS